MNRNVLILLPLLMTSCMDYQGQYGSDIPVRNVRNSQVPSANADKDDNASSSDEQEGDAGAIDEEDDISLFKSCDSATNRKYEADLYRVTDETTRLPDLANLRSWGKVCMQELNISQRTFEEGFPGMPDVNTFFALDVNFKLKVETAGEYIFFLSSDNGSKLFLDGVKVVDNDGKHEEQLKSGKIVLSAGEHVVNVQYMQLDGRIALELKWQPPSDVAPSNLPAKLVTRP